jgi:hypothetical protein
MAQELIGYKAVSDRDIYMMRTQPVNITFVQVNAPTTSAEAEVFYRSLNVTLKKAPKKMHL